MVIGAPDEYNQVACVFKKDTNNDKIEMASSVIVIQSIIHYSVLPERDIVIEYIGVFDMIQ